MGNLPPTFRFPFNLDPDAAVEGDEKGWKRLANNAVRYVFSGLLDAQQAISALNDKIKPSSSSTAGSMGGSTIGQVNDQSGQAAYTVQQADYGALVVVSNGGGVNVALNGVIEKPFYARIKVDSGSGTAVITPQVGTINQAGFIHVAAGTTVDVFFNSDDFNWTSA